MRKIILYVALGLIALLLVFIGLSSLSAYRQKAAIRKVSDAFTSEVLAGNASASFDLFTASNQSSFDSEDWQAQVQTLSSSFKGSPAKYLSTTISSSLAFVNYSIAGPDGNYNLSLSLTKQSNGWRVQSFTNKFQP